MEMIANPVLLFDGVCNLCNGMVQVVLKNESNSQIKFAALQSKTGQLYLEKFQLDKKSLNSIVFIENNTVYVKSEAAFRIAKHLKQPWSLIAIFRFSPRFINDFVYDIVAKIRYRVFGKSETCMMPEAKWESRFLK